MKLGELIDALSKYPSDAPVWIGEWRPGELASYRGAYEHLALGRSYEDVTVAELRQSLASAIGKVFRGYKGGNYKMGKDTEVYVSDAGEASGEWVSAVLLSVSSGIVYLEVSS